MSPYFELPDWESMSSCNNLSSRQTDKFLQESIINNLHFYWEKIVNNPKVDNSQIVEIWEKVCINPVMKEDFVNWYVKQNHFKSQGVYYTYKDVMRYLTYKKHSLDNSQQPTSDKIN